MPINRELKHLYPPNWKQIRFGILERANNRCEFCGVKNYDQGYRDVKGDFLSLDALEDDNFDYSAYQFPRKFIEQQTKPIKIILTVAHLDHHPENNDPQNLRALCQRCHLKHDQVHHIRNRIMSPGQVFLNFG